ncbi:YihY/virulence factor BrkB family protein [Streptomyces sp. RFCAC02]|uniref:YihY/virulence factor BrkB family protein n=1 Tax=Streptomyces sp. RFCAC02 TaxID=2499143 RepID=UPI001F102AE8|nr:YihY/virulence factor BrkB family protein [Streptomyces sp. RFCAC02]
MSVTPSPIPPPPPAGPPATAPAEPPAPRATASGGRWATALRRTPVSLWRDDIDHWAAALTYYSVLAVFPALFVALSILGLADPGSAEELIGQVSALVPADSRGEVWSALHDLAQQRSAAWLLVAVGGFSALLSGYNYLSIFRRVQHAMHGVRDPRSPWRAIPRTTLSALGLLGLLVGSATVLIMTGGVVRTVGRWLGFDEAGTAAWSVMKWPLLVLLVTGLVLVLFRNGPKDPGVPAHGMLGGALAVGLWLVASAGFALYASHVGTYNRLYGSLAGIVVFLVWLWVCNLSLLTGAQFNAELARLNRARASYDARRAADAA